MSNVSITTSQNVDIEYEIANIGDRILALLADYLIISGYFLAMGVLIYFLSRAGINPGFAFYIIVFAAPVFIYDLVCEIFLNGQSLGKRIRRIKVIKLDGSQPSVWDYIIRWIFRLIDVGIFTGAVAIITIAINGKGQRLGDIAAGTTVVRIKQSSGFKDTIFADIEENYKPRFPDAARLDGETAAVIKEVLNSAESIKSKKVFGDLAKKTKKAVEKKLGISSRIEPVQFLTTILKDYNYFSG
jgi:uncharacterized RDD family membrane protein YckC